MKKFDKKLEFGLLLGKVSRRRFWRALGPHHISMPRVCASFRSLVDHLEAKILTNLVNVKYKRFEFGWLIIPI